jgi:hypothetical protein
LLEFLTLGLFQRNIRIADIGLPQGVRLPCAIAATRAPVAFELPRVVAQQAALPCLGHC